VDVIVLIALVWLFLLVLAVAILRTAGQADRAAERRLHERETRVRPTRAPGPPTLAARTPAPRPRSPART
jgi:hypothetical protein